MHLNRILRHSTPLLVYAALAVMYLAPILGSGGTVGLSHDWGIPPYPAQLEMWRNRIRWIFRDNYMGVDVFNNHYWTVLSISVLGWMGANGEVVTKLFLLFSLAASGLSMHLLCRAIGLPKISYVSGILYMSTPVIFNRLSAGHIFYVASYPAAPLLFAFLIKAFLARDRQAVIRNVLIASILFSITLTTVQYLLVTLLAMTLYSLTLASRRKDVSRNFFLVTVVTALALLTTPYLTAEILDPQRAAGVVSTTIVKRSTAEWMSSNTNLLKSFTLQASQGNYTEGVLEKFGLWIWWPSALLISGLAFLTILFRRDSALRPHIITWLIVNTVLLYLATGTRAPLGAMVWGFLYDNARLLATIYKDISHLLSLPALGYSLLFGISFTNLTDQRTKTRLGRGFVRRKTLIAILYVSLVLAYVSPSVFGYSLTLQTYTWSDEYRQLYSDLAKSDVYSRVLWVPSIAYGMTYRGLKLAGLDPMIDNSPKPSFPQLLGAAAARLPYATGNLAYTEMVRSMLSPYAGDLQSADVYTKYPGYVLSFGSIREVILAKEAYTVTRFADQYRISQKVLQSQVDLKRNKSFDGIDVFVNEDTLPIIYAATGSEASILAGSVKDLIPLSYLNTETKSLPRQKLFILASQLSEEEFLRTSKIVDHVVIGNEAFYDLLFTLIPEAHRIDPNNFLDGSQGWYPVDGWGFDFRVGGSNIALPAEKGKPSVLWIQHNVPSDGAYTLLIKNRYGPTPEYLTVLLDGDLVANLTTHGVVETYRWSRFDSLSLTRGPHKLTLIGAGWESVQYIILAPEKEVNRAMGDLEAVLRGKTINLLELEKPTRLERGWSPLKVLGEASQGYALKSTAKTGKAVYELFISETGSHVGYVRAKTDTLARLEILFRNNQNYVATELSISPRKGFAWYPFTVNIPETGWYKFEISAEAADVTLDILALTSFQGSPLYSKEPKRVLSLEKIDPTAYRVGLNVTQPIFLVHNVNYNPRWTVSVTPGTNVEKIVANGYAQAYHIATVGQYNVLLKHRGQVLLDSLLLVAGVTLGSMSLLLICLEVRCHRKRNKTG